MPKKKAEEAVTTLPPDETPQALAEEPTGAQEVELDLGGFGAPMAEEETGTADVGTAEGDAESAELNATGLDESPLEDASGTWQCQNTTKCPDAKTGKTFTGPTQRAAQAANTPIFCPTCEGDHVLYITDNPKEASDGA